MARPGSFRAPNASSKPLFVGPEDVPPTKEQVPQMRLLSPPVPTEGVGAKDKQVMTSTDAKSSFRVEITNELTYSFGSVDNVRRYDHEYLLGCERYRVTSRHALRCFKDGREVGSAILGAAGGASGVHERSMVLLGDRCFVAVGPFAVALELPSLTLVWSSEVDSATCFGLYVSSDGRALLSHGELEVARVTFAGEIVWQSSGADIFTEGFAVDHGVVRVIDFNGRSYVLDEATGHEVQSLGLD